MAFLFSAPYFGHQGLVLQAPGFPCESTRQTGASLALCTKSAFALPRLTCQLPFQPSWVNNSKHACLEGTIASLEAKGGAKASAPEWESGGQRGRKKHGALFGGSQGDVAVASQRSTCRADCRKSAGRVVRGCRASAAARYATLTACQRATTGRSRTCEEGGREGGRREGGREGGGAGGREGGSGREGGRGGREGGAGGREGGREGGEGREGGRGEAEGRTPCTSSAGQTIPGEESYVALCPDPPEREEREERRKDERQKRGERERVREREREEREMRKR